MDITSDIVAQWIEKGFCWDNCFLACCFKRDVLIFVYYDQLGTQRLMILSFVENRIFMRPFVF